MHISQPFGSSCILEKEWKTERRKTRDRKVVVIVSSEQAQGFRARERRRVCASSIFAAVMSCPSGSKACRSFSAGPCMPGGGIHALCSTGSDEFDFSIFRLSRVSRCFDRSNLALVKLLFLPSPLYCRAGRSAGDTSSVSSSSVEPDDLVRIDLRAKPHGSVAHPATSVNGRGREGGILQWSPSPSGRFERFAKRQDCRVRRTGPMFQNESESRNGNSVRDRSV